MLGKAKELEILEHAITSVVAMNAAIINIRLFPRGSNMIDKVTDKVYQALQAIFESKDSVVFAESEKTLLVCEQLLGEKDQKKPQIISFLELLLNFGIKSITFTKDLEKAELKTFLEIMSKKPEEVHNEGELQQIVEYNSLPHILIDETVYIAVHKDQQIVANLNIKDEELVKYLMGVHQGSEMDPENIKEMAKNPEWVTNVFHAGVQYLAEQKGTVPNVQLSENFVHMIRTLDHIADNIVKEEVTQQVSKSIADMDIEMISMILIQNMEGLLGDELFNHIINQIEDEKFEKIAMRIKQMYDHSSSQGTYHETSSLESVHHAYQNMMNSDKGRQLQSNIQERIVQ
ncbi:MAG: hypothetical protein SVW57_06835 [Thermodesulfobacteriota bacterium]|nr:hypothetical protein [Thermodesulfobacteriota bacterium]